MMIIMYKFFVVTLNVLSLLNIWITFIVDFSSMKPIIRIKNNICWPILIHIKRMHQRNISLVQLTNCMEERMVTRNPKVDSAFISKAHQSAHQTRGWRIIISSINNVTNIWFDEFNTFQRWCLCEIQPKIEFEVSFGIKEVSWLLEKLTWCLKKKFQNKLPCWLENLQWLA